MLSGPDVVVPTVRPHESENLIRIPPGKQRDVVGLAPDSEVLLQPEEIKSLVDEPLLRAGDESFRARLRHAHRESLRATLAAERVGAEERRGGRSLKNRAGSPWCANGTRSTPR